MVNFQETTSSHCPYCGEPIQLIIDCSIDEQRYIEDCEVCCRPMEVWVCCRDGEIAELAVRAEFD